MLKVNYVNDEKSVVLFDLRDIDSDIRYSGLSLRKSKKGEWFISEPSYKGKNGQYYKYYVFTENIKERLIDVLITHLEETNYTVDSAARHLFNF